MLNKFKPKSEFTRSVLTLMTGTAIAQAIPIIISPIITRLYTPSDLGSLAVFLSVTVILSTIATGKYELAINISKIETHSNLLVITSIFSAIVFSIVISCFLITYKVSGINIQFLTSLGVWIYYIPVSIIFTGAYLAFNYWHIRKKYFIKISSNRVYQSSVNGFFTVFIGYITGGSLGVFLGEIFSRILVTFLHAYRFLKEFRSKDKLFLKIIATMKKHTRYPLFMMPGSLLNIGAKEVPMILFSALYSQSFVGLIVLSQRVISAPLGIVTAAFSESLLQKFTSEINIHGNCYNPYKKALIFLALAGIIPAILFFLIAPRLFAFVFGNDWKEAGTIVRILIPFYYIYMTSGTLNIVFIAAGKHKLSLFLQIIFFVMTISSILLSYMLYKDSYTSLYFFSFANSLYFIVALFVSHKVAKGIW